MKYLLLLLTTLSISCFSDYQSVEAQYNEQSHKEFKWADIYEAPGHLDHAKLDLFSDGKAHFSSTVATDSTPIIFVIYFELYEQSGKIIKSPYYLSACVKKEGSPHEWNFDFTFSPSLYDTVATIKLNYAVTDCVAEELSSIE